MFNQVSNKTASQGTQNQQYPQIIGALKKRPNAKSLTNHIRLIVYSFIDTKMCLTHLTRLSKKEKQRLMNSYIVRQGRK